MTITPKLRKFLLAFAGAALLGVSIVVGSAYGASQPSPVPGTAVQVDTVPEAALTNAGIQLQQPDPVEVSGAKVDSATARSTALGHWPAYRFVDDALVRWHSLGRDLGGVVPDGRLVWVVVAESPDGYYVHGGPNSSVAQTAHLDVIDAKTGEWLGAVTFGR